MHSTNVLILSLKRVLLIVGVKAVYQPLQASHALGEMTGPSVRGQPVLPRENINKGLLCRRFLVAERPGQAPSSMTRAWIS